MTTQYKTVKIQEGDGTVSTVQVPVNPVTSSSTPKTSSSTTSQQTKTVTIQEGGGETSQVQVPVTQPRVAAESTAPVTTRTVRINEGSGESSTVEVPSRISTPTTSSKRISTTQREGETDRAARLTQEREQQKRQQARSEAITQQVREERKRVISDLRKSSPIDRTVIRDENVSTFLGKNGQKVKSVYTNPNGDSIYALKSGRVVVFTRGNEDIARFELVSPKSGEELLRRQRDFEFLAEQRRERLAALAEVIPNEYNGKRELISKIKEGKPLDKYEIELFLDSLEYRAETLKAVGDLVSQREKEDALSEIISGSAEVAFAVIPFGKVTKAVGKTAEIATGFTRSVETASAKRTAEQVGLKKLTKKESLALAKKFLNSKGSKAISVARRRELETVLKRDSVRKANNELALRRAVERVTAKKARAKALETQALRSRAKVKLAAEKNAEKLREATSNTPKVIEQETSLVIKPKSALQAEQKAVKSEIAQLEKEIKTVPQLQREKIELELGRLNFRNAALTTAISLGAYSASQLAGKSKTSTTSLTGAIVLPQGGPQQVTGPREYVQSQPSTLTIPAGGITQPSPIEAPSTTKIPTGGETPSKSTPGRIPAPQRPTRNPPKAPVGRGVLPSIKRDTIEIDGKRVPIEGTVGWKQGFGWYVLYPPYRQSNLIFTRERPVGIVIRKNAESAVRYVILSGGKIPKNTRLKIGAFELRISSRGREPEFEFKRIKRIR